MITLSDVKCKQNTSKIYPVCKEPKITSHEIPKGTHWKEDHYHRKRKIIRSECGNRRPSPYKSKNSSF